MKNFKVTSAALTLAVVLSAGKCGKDQAENTDPTIEETTAPDTTTTENQEVAPAEEGTKTEESVPATPADEKTKEPADKQANTAEQKK